MRRVFYIMTTVMLVLSACTKQQGEEYFPKPSQGAQWEYILQIATPEGKHEGRILIRIDGEETINGKKYYKQINTISGNPRVDIIYNRRAKEGIYRIDGNQKDRPEYLWMPFPIKVGSTWTVQAPGGTRHYRAENIVPVQLINRKYENCLRVSFQIDNESKRIEGASFFAPGIGEVLCVQKLGGNAVSYFLDKYKL